MKRTLRITLLTALAASDFAAGVAVAQTPPTFKTDRSGPLKEGVCQTTPGSGQTSMSDAVCDFIAGQISVLASARSNGNAQTDVRVPSPAWKPGSDIPSSVTDLKPLPKAVTDRYPALKGDQYFLAGQDIVVVEHGAKIAFVVNVRVLPKPSDKRTHD